MWIDDEVIRGTISGGVDLLSVIDVFGACFAVLSADGTLVSCDDSYPGLLGHTHDSIQGMTASKVTHPDDRARYEHLVQRAAREGSGFIVRKRSLHQNGSIVWVQNRVTLMRSPSGPQLLVATRRIDPPEPRLTMPAWGELLPCAGYVTDLAGQLGRMSTSAGLHLTAELLEAASRLAPAEADIVSAHHAALN